MAGPITPGLFISVAQEDDWLRQAMTSYSKAWVSASSGCPVRFPSLGSASSSPKGSSRRGRWSPCIQVNCTDCGLCRVIDYVHAIVFYLNGEMLKHSSPHKAPCTRLMSPSSSSPLETRLCSDASTASWWTATTKDFPNRCTSKKPDLMYSINI